MMLTKSISAIKKNYSNTLVIRLKKFIKFHLKNFTLVKQPCYITLLYKLAIRNDTDKVIGIKFSYSWHLSKGIAMSFATWFV